ncbi:DUF559 domain-containing protein [Luteimicrobium sp. NPDC057192]|uniref:DUF559 domain-containing protein n=1 Tax=Luteimicrobium sp. NPDC057192 TaxID=3346042 RepID=UPI00362E8742
MTNTQERPRDVGVSLEPPELPEVERYSRGRRHEIEARVRDGTLVRLRTGVYGPRVVEDSVAKRVQARMLQQVRAAVERLRGEFWFSHVTAAVLWGCWTWKSDGLVHLTELSNPSIRRSSERMMRRHWTPLPQRDRSSINGIPVTSLERTAVDCARMLRPGPALVVLDAALRKRADRRLMATILEESRGKRGVRQARELLPLAVATSESPGESIVRWVALDAGLRPPSTAIPVVTEIGKFWVDLGWEDLKIGIEFDGEEKYSGKYGEPAEVRRQERERQAALERDGWIILRFRWDDFLDLDTIAEEVRRALAHRHAPAK